MAGRMVYISDAPPANHIELFADQPDVLSVPKVAELIGVDPSTIRREIDRGMIKVAHVGRCIRITKTALLEYLGEANED